MARIKVSIRVRVSFTTGGNPRIKNLKVRRPVAAPASFLVLV